MNARTAIVHVVDDDASVRESLALLLEVRGMETRSHSDARSFLANCKGDEPGCVLLDLRMPGMDGSTLQAEMARREMDLPVIIITAHGDVAATRAAFKAGACDFIEKPVDPDALCAAIDVALELDASSRERAARAEEAAARLAALTGREREVVDHAVTGLHNREIASELGISVRTVEVYKARAMEKLGVRRLPDLVHLVMRAERTKA